MKGKQKKRKRKENKLQKEFLILKVSSVKVTDFHTLFHKQTLAFIPHAHAHTHPRTSSRTSHMFYVMQHNRQEVDLYR